MTQYFHPPANCDPNAAPYFTAEQNAQLLSQLQASSYPRLRRVGLREALSIMFDRAEAAELIPIGSIRPARDSGNPYLRAEHPIPGDRMTELLPPLLANHRDWRRYTQLVSFLPESCKALKSGRPIVYEGGTLFFEAKNEFVRRIFGIMLDLDLGRDGTMDDHFGYLEVLRLLDSNQLPEPSFVVFSGRGLYLIYLLRDSDGNPLLATNTTRSIRTAVIEDLLARLHHLSPDRVASKSLARWFKAPSEVSYYVFDPDDRDTPLVWSLESLLDWGFAHPANDPNRRTFSSIAETVVTTPSFDGSKRKASRRSWEQSARPSIVRAEELVRLANRRGMDEDSGRHNLLLYYGAAVRDVEHRRTGDMKQAQCSALAAARRLNATFVTSLTDAEVVRALRSDGGMHHKSSTVASSLGITDEEVALLKLTSTLPEHIRIRRDAAKHEKKAAKVTRQKMIDRLLCSGLPPACIIRLTGTPKSTINSRKGKLRRIPGTVALDSGRIFNAALLAGTRLHT